MKSTVKFSLAGAMLLNCALFLISSSPAAADDDCDYDPQIGYCRCVYDMPLPMCVPHPSVEKNHCTLHSACR